MEVYSPYWLIMYVIFCASIHRAITLLIMTLSALGVLGG